MVRNLTRDTILAHRPRTARTPWMRARGMIGCSFRDFDALVIPHCRSVHTWFMGTALDLVFVDAGGRVLRTEIEAGPWRIFFGPRGTRTVIELPSPSLNRVPVQRGDQIGWEASGSG